MAISTPVIVATATADGTNPKTFTYNGSVGKFYVLMLGRYLAADSFTSISDTGGNVWTRADYAPKSGTTGRRVEVWTCKPTAPFTSVSANQNNTGFGDGVLIEVTGTSGVINAKNALESAGTTAPAAVNVTPTKSNTLVISAVQVNPLTQAQITASAGWTRLTTPDTTPAVAYKLNPTSGVATGVSWTFSTSNGSATGIIALEEQTTGPWFQWNGTTEVPLTLDGIWNGTSITPASFGSVYDGSESPAAPTMLVGMDSLPENTASDFAAFPGVMYHRDFGLDNRYGTDADTLPEFTPYGYGLRWQNLPQGAVMHVSAKDDVELFNNFLDSIPDTPPAYFKGVYASPWHEPHDDVRNGTITAADIRAWGARMTQIKNTHPKGKWVLGVGPILTRYDFDEAPVRAQPGDYGWSGMDFYGVDCYWSASNGGYPTNTQMFETCFNKILAVYPGIKFMVPEYGMVKQSSDSTGSARATAINNHIAYLRSRGDVLGIAYFNEVGSIPGVPLDDTPSADAWRAALASQ